MHSGLFASVKFLENRSRLFLRSLRRSFRSPAFSSPLQTFLINEMPMIPYVRDHTQGDDYSGHSPESSSGQAIWTLRKLQSYEIEHDPKQHTEG